MKTKAKMIESASDYMFNYTDVVKRFHHMILKSDRYETAEIFAQYVGSIIYFYRMAQCYSEDAGNIDIQ